MTLLYLAFAWLLGCALVRWFFPAPLRSTLHNVLVISLGAGVGIGIASSIFFLSLALGGASSTRIAVLAAAEGLALAAALALGILIKRRGTLLEWAPGPPTPWYLTAAFGLAFATAAAIFIV